MGDRRKIVENVSNHKSSNFVRISFLRFVGTTENLNRFGISVKMHDKLRHDYSECYVKDVLLFEQMYDSIDDKIR